ncbi:rho GTPase-activating protein 30-like [Myxocyprinus asiaticus]|uniref:rho GTPase-activating protein 30-like n=1 Tax=Myxocyprinus asiaticus TaxID=70543 RepID=UPI0022217032|nr:rho GTPase-activating protein 30-like [Myxocyprinus asiaticus]XP_051557439.1 rho GTPase-activating protein 30-like [Myxocyprinus asiaticus]XP_051557440.1 rho GTPase-activating protein 30-like [Myxocyprinus asiaticus]
MRRGRRKGGSREKVFGCDLLEHLTSTAQEIPLVLRSCSEFIEEHGIVDGIYRLSGVSSNTQKLRSEFDSEGTPDLCKDVYLQDIHCVSSLCKAYFRELPNPLLTYELYDRFADAVAIQLEDERLVKIKEVLKDLPVPHYRTLEYLMRHLVKMSTFASQTNMHARNLAIVWAPNLLRSKDIESTGFNGTAAFMEVRVQSIVVEFILTHVTELFPGSGLAVERRKSLPSPSVLSNQDDHFFKSLPLHCSGNLSPGDGPPPMRPYHAIIDGTDKRKGSLKGRKWRSIFNLGARLHDPRKKNKYCPKDKEEMTLRPAKSMDSLSTGPYGVEDSKHPPLVLSVASGSSEGMSSVGGGMSSGYAVTYRRTGGAQVSMVSGGTAGTYNRLDAGGGATGAEGSSHGVSRSPGMTNKADRRAGIHISGPFSVTVPLHITSGLALGVLQGGWNEKEEDGEEDQPETEDGNDTGQKEEERMSTDGNSQTERKNNDVLEINLDSQVDCGKEITMITGKENVTPEKQDTTIGAEKEDLTLNQEPVKANVEDTEPQDKKETIEGVYMDMRGHLNQESSAAQWGTDCKLSPVYVEFSEQDFPLDVQEAFGFLDLMDSSASNQIEFSVEPPCFEEEDEEVEDENKDNQALSCATQNHSIASEVPVAKSISPTIKHRPLPGKSHSLPYKSRPFMPALSLSSDDEYSPGDDDEDDDSDKGSEYEDMFCQSLPSSRDFHGLSWSSPQTSASVNSVVDVHSINQSECLDEEHRIYLPEYIKDVQSIIQSEDVILAATTIIDNREEHLSSDDLKMNDHHMDEKKNEERESEDVENDIDTLTVEDNPESEASEEDTYFGPDLIPSLPEPNQTKIASNISVHDEPIQGQFTDVAVQQVPDADVYQDNTVSDVIIADDLTVTDSASLAPQDEVKMDHPPEEQKTFSGDRDVIEEMRTSEDGATEEEEKKSDETTEEGEKILEAEELKTTEHEEKWSENEENPEEKAENMEEFININEIVQELEENGSVEGCSDEKVEQKDLEENDGEKMSNDKNVGGSEENANNKTDSCYELSSTDIAEGNISHEGITEEIFEVSSFSNDLEQSTFIHQPDEIPCEKMEDREMEEEAMIPDVELPQSVEHNDAPELERVTNDPKQSPSKLPYQVKAVPVVPPKPQNSKLTAFTLRQKQRYSQVMDTDGQHAKLDETDEQHIENKKQRENEKTEETDETTEIVKKQLKETDVDGMSREDETMQEREDPRERQGTWDGGKDVIRETEKEVKRNSTISMCFDEAVARATVKRSRERENTDRLSGVQRERENRRDRSKTREKEDESKTD